MTASPRALLDPPGGMFLWIIVALELITFSIIFVILANFRASEPGAFADGQAFLDRRLGFAQTLALLTSGWLVAEAVHAYRLGRKTRARRFYAGGIAVGVVFVALKVFSYVLKSRAGLGLDSDFGAFYFLATGFHFAHVLVGLMMLSYVALKIGRKPFEDEEVAIAGTALFWHMCDLAWFFLFPLFYAR